MKSLQRIFLIAGAVCAATFLLITPAQPGRNYLVSVSATGEGGNAHSYGAHVSADGRFVAFSSRADNLVPNDTNGAADVFLRDTLARTTQRISTSSSGQEGDADSWATSITADGTVVAFSSEGSNLVPEDTNDTSDAFVHERLSGTMERVSVSSTGEQGNARSTAPSLSADGRLVVFFSAASNLVPGDTNQTGDVFVRDRLTGTTERVSVSTSRGEGNGVSGFGSISGDGRYVVFVSFATNLVPEDTNGVPDVFLHDRETGETIRVSVAGDGSEGDGSCWEAAISADGRRVVFVSESTNLVPGARSGSWCVYLRDLDAGHTILVPYSGHGTSPAISADGRYVAFNGHCAGIPMDGHISEGECFRLYDTTAGEYSLTGFWCARDPSLSADDRYLAYEGAWCYLCYYSTGDPPYYCYTPPGPYQVSLYDRFPEEVPPETQVVQGPCGQTVCASEPTICWSGSDDETPAEYLEYLWRVDGGAWQGPTSQTCVTLSGLSDGQHLFEVKAKDRAGNEDPTPAQCSFTVDAAPPNVSITAPANGATVKGVVTISANASDPSGIERVELYARGQLLCSDATAPYSCNWDTRPVSVAEGPAQICVKAYGSCGHSAKACITVTVDNTTFDDVPKTDPVWWYVEALAREGITGGCATNPSLFCPYGKITRAQMAVLLCRAVGKAPLNRDTPTFCDVPKTNPYYGWIERIADRDSWNGNPLTIGCMPFPCRQYCPWKSVTRDEMAAFLVRAAGKLPMSSCSGVFSDVPAYWACPYIERLAHGPSWLGNLPVTNGCALDPPRYCPKSYVTRGQMAVFLVRAFGLPL